MELYNIVTKQYHSIKKELETYNRSRLGEFADDLLQEYLDSPGKFKLKYGESLTNYTDIYVDSFNRSHSQTVIKYDESKDMYEIYCRGIEFGWLERHGCYTAHEILEAMPGETHMISSHMQDNVIEMITQLRLYDMAMSDHGRLVRVCETVEEARKMLLTNQANKVAISVEEIIEEYFCRHTPNVYETAGGPLDVFQAVGKDIFPMESFNEWVDTELRPHMSWTEVYDMMHPTFDTADKYVDASFKKEVVSLSDSAAEELAQDFYINRPTEVMKSLYEGYDPEGIENYIVEEMLPALGLLDTQTVVLLDW